MSTPLLRKVLFGVLLLLFTATSCTPPPESLRFDDPRILRGNYSGTVSDWLTPNAVHIEADTLTLVQQNTNSQQYSLERQGAATLQADLPDLTGATRFALSSTHLAVSSNEGMQLFELDGLEPILTLPGGIAEQVSFSADGSRLLLSRFPDISVIDIASGQTLPLELRGRGLGLSPDGEQVLLIPESDIGNFRLLEVHNLTDGSVHRLAHSSAIRDAFALLNGDTLTLTHDAMLRRWGADGNLVSSLQLPQDIRNVALSPDGFTLALRTAEGITLWNLRESRALTRIRLTEVFIDALRFSSDGSYLGATSTTHTTLYRSGDGSLIRRYSHRPDSAARFTFQPHFENAIQYRIEGTLEFAGNTLTLEGFVGGGRVERYLAPQIIPITPVMLGARSPDGIWVLSALSGNPQHNAWGGRLENTQENSVYYVQFIPER